jgi:DNA segregation ATPase FtsK/SpoIIIE, S-DNA-T family
VGVSVVATVVATKHRPSGARHASRSASGHRRQAKPAQRSAGRKAVGPARGRATAKNSRTSSATRSLSTVLASHSTDLWGLGLATLGLLAAIAIFGDSLGPAGHGLRVAAGDLFGTGRFALPPAFLAAGILLVAGRSTEREPIRAGVGLALAVWAISGLAAAAGGSPGLGASEHELAGAGGLLGAVACDPLRAGLGTPGASVVLLAVLGVALVVLTGVGLRTAAVGVAGFARFCWQHLASAARSISQMGEVVIAADADKLSSGADDDDLDSGIDFDIDEPVAPPAPVALEDPEIGVEEPEPAQDVRPAQTGTRGSRLAPIRNPRQSQLDLAAVPGEWRLPHVGILARSRARSIDRGEIATAGRALVAALAAHGVETKLVGHTVGPTVTRYELELGPGVKVARVTSLAKDIAYAMASPDVRILAPIPGKSAIGIEVPNRQRQLVTLGDVLSSEEAAQAVHPLEVALGRDIAGRPVMANLADMPHILISGATGAGKSSCINSLLTSILVRSTPEQVRMILVDPKRVELGQYNGLPHLLTQVVVDPKKAANALSWAVAEMERRYDLLAEVGMRDITGYNLAIDRGEIGSGPPVEVPDETSEEFDEEFGDEESDDEEEEALTVAERVEEVRQAVEPESTRHTRLSFILVVVDELNDLMMVAARDVEESVCRIAQMARAVGIHLVLATQRPSVDVITGVIKANIPSRLAFSVSSLADSRVILDQPGAERLIGKGDMLLLTASSSVPRRIQGPWVTEEEVRAVVAHWRRQSQPEYVTGIAEEGASGPGPAGLPGDDDEFLMKAMDLVVRSQLGSTSMLQRKLRVGFSRAGRLMDLLEQRGVVGPSEGSKARSVLMTVDELDQMMNA